MLKVYLNYNFDHASSFVMIISRKCYMKDHKTFIEFRFCVSE